MNLIELCSKDFKMKTLLIALFVVASNVSMASIFNCGDEEIACHNDVLYSVSVVERTGLEVVSAKRSTGTTIGGSYICAYSLKMDDGSEDIFFKKSVQVVEGKCLMQGQGITVEKEVAL